MLDGSAGWPASARHCLRLGAFNDKTLVERAQGSFDIVGLQANLAVSASRGLSSWQQLEKPFWLDPITYAFAAAPAYLMSEQKVERGRPETRLDFKKTFRSLAEAYGDPFVRLTNERRSLEPADFDDVDLPALVARIIEWQRGILQPSEEDKKYLDINVLEPVLLTIPFFPLQRPPEKDMPPPWLGVNKRLIEEAANQYPSDRLVAGLLIEDNLFDTDEMVLQPILNDYQQTSPDHLWLWVSDNDEEVMTTPRAQRLRDFVRATDELGKRVHQAFGGSFSTLLLREGLTSVGHGVGYWEHKNWEPIAGGGLPSLRFFFPPLMSRLRFLDADILIDSTIQDAADFHTLICDCDTCHDTLRGSLANFALYGQVEVRTTMTRQGRRREYDVPLPPSLARTKTHYLKAKGLEVDRVLTASVKPAEILDASISRYEGQDFVDIRHLRNWRYAFA